MTTISREFLSEGTNGLYVNITASGSPGNVIHTAINAGNQKDEIWLWGVTNAGTNSSIIIEWGGLDDVTDILSVGMPAANGEQLLVAGRSLAGGLEVRAYVNHAVASVSGLNIGGHVNRSNPDA
jgi:hypothetical protein